MIGIITINQGRPKILRLWCAQIQRIRAELSIDIPACVVSDIDDRIICNTYKVKHIEQENNPVTAKFNTAFHYMKGMDAVMILGSDDIVSTDIVRQTIEKAEKGYDLIGIRSFYFYAGDGVDRGKLVRYDRPNSISFLGIAKTVSKRVLDKCDWTPWTEEKNWGMDAIANRTFIKYAEKNAEVSGVVVDVKTRTNQLNSFNLWKDRLPQCDPQIFYDILSKEELQILKSL